MPHTRKEILEWGREMADKIFHGKNEEQKLRKNEEQKLKGWLARDKNGRVFFHSHKPRKYADDVWVADKGFNRGIAPLDFHSIKWEDDEPTPCEITVKLK